MTPQFVYIKNFDELCTDKVMSIKAKYQKVKDCGQRIDQRMRQPVATGDVVHEHHVCNHCGYGYEGRYCPQCGMSSQHARFTFSRLTSNFLDIWGFGNRPMFRSIRDLLWRPGYMIRDYLEGHHLSYFPPFKMLAVLTLVIVFVTWLFDFEDPLVSVDVAQALNSVPHTSKITALVFDYIGRVLVYLDKNDLYRILVQNVFVVLAAWVVFHNKGYNLVETFFSQIYINCQMHLVAILWMLITWNLPPTFFLPYFVPAPLSVIVLVFDYKQLYGLTFTQSIVKTLLFILLVLAIYVVMFVLLLFLFGALDEMTGVG